MHHSTEYDGQQDQLINLFETTFGASEGMAEGRLIGELVRNLLSQTPQEELRVYTSWDQEVLIAAFLATRLTFDQDPRSVYLVAPVAVKTDRQRGGVGQAVLRFGLSKLKEEAEFAITYGDPDYYKKVGFKPITEDQAAAPLPLSYPHGWLGQSLTKEGFDPLSGPSRCVAAFNNPAYW